MSDDKSLIPVEQKTVEFYEDEVTAVRLQNGQVFVPIRPICENLGVTWSPQLRRINRDPVLSEEATSVTVTVTQQGREMICLPLKFIPGWLFGINADRVKPEIRERLIQYQRECYDVLSAAFTEGRLTSDPSFHDLLDDESPAAIAYKMATALQLLARQQLLLESRMEHRFEVVDQRLEAIESQLGDPAHTITPDQAMQLSQAVKTVAMHLSKASGRNEYGGVYGELYRKFGITSYKQLPATKFQEAIDWLNEWHESISGDTPF